MRTPRHLRFPNPFYIALMVVSTVFVVSAIAYLMVPMLAQQALVDPRLAHENPATPGFAHWLDHSGPTYLGVLFVMMLVLSVLAMATDHWFSEGKRLSGR